MPRRIKRKQRTGREIDAIGEVDDVEHAEHEREAEREQCVGCAGNDAVDELLGEHIRNFVARWLTFSPSGEVPCEAGRIRGTPPLTLIRRSLATTPSPMEREGGLTIGLR